MDDVDAWFEYALDVPEPQRQQALAELRQRDPALAERVQAMLRDLVTNPDFACQGSSLAAQAQGPARVLAVGLPVADLDAAVRWYQDVFRCQLVTRQPERAVLAFSNLELHLLLGETAAPGLLVQQQDVQRLGATARRADGSRSLHLVDPFGNPFEVVDSPRG